MFACSERARSGENTCRSYLVEKQKAPLDHTSSWSRIPKIPCRADHDSHDLTHERMTPTHSQTQSRPQVQNQDGRMCHALIQCVQQPRWRLAAVCYQTLPSSDRSTSSRSLALATATLLLPSTTPTAWANKRRLLCLFLSLHDHDLSSARTE